MNTGKEAGHGNAGWSDREAGAYWEDFKRDILGRDVRVTFPITKLAHDGGSTMLRQWAIAMRQCADQLETLSQHHPDREEHTRLFYAAGALRRLAGQMNRTMPRRGR